MKIILCIRSMIFSHLSVEGVANNTTEEGTLVPMDLTFLIEFTLFSMSVEVIGIFSTPASIKQALVLLVPAFAAAKKWNLMKAVTETAAPSPPHCTLCPESMEYVQEKLCLGGILFPPPSLPAELLVAGLKKSHLWVVGEDFVNIQLICLSWHRALRALSRTVQTDIFRPDLIPFRHRNLRI